MSMSIDYYFGKCSEIDLNLIIVHEIIGIFFSIELKTTEKNLINTHVPKY